MIRILQIGMTDNLGGIETFLINYYRKIDKEKYQFDFINIYNNPLCFQEEIINMGGKIYNVSSYYKHPIKYIREVVKIINENNYEIIHCNMNSAAMIFPLVAGKISNAKVVISHSHNSSSDKGLPKTILHNIGKHFIPIFANTYFSCSLKAGEWFYSKKILKSDNHYIIYNSVDLNKFKYDEKLRSKIRKKFNIDDDNFVIGHVGRFNKQKNHAFLIKVFNEIHKINENSTLFLIGQGPLQKRIEEKVKKLNLEKSVIFLGKRNDVSELYNAMDLFVLPSLYEGLPLVGIEAQASNVECVFSDSITHELQISDKCWYIPLNKELWTRLILIISTNKKSNKANNSIDTSNFDINISTNRLINIYDERLRKYGKL